MDLFRPDKPISAKTDDKFQRYIFSQRIAQIITAGKHPSSLVVGIYGKWGEGKTSVINFIRQEISTETIVVNFNPWIFSDEKQLVAAFFENIAAALGKKLTSLSERVWKTFKDYSEGIGSLSSLFVPGAAGISKIGEKIADKLQKGSIEDLKSKVDELIVEANTNFVIFIDDIDRLEAKEVQAIFKLVKLLGDFPRTCYVLSFDDDMVAAALGPKYGNRDKKSGYDFLEKIIQVPLQLPKANSQALRTYTIELLNKALDSIQTDIDQNESSDFLNKFDKAFLPALINPRLGVRYANSISFSIPLLKGEVNMSDLMIMEGVKTFYPPLYHFIRSTPQYFIRNYVNTGNIIASVTEKEKEEVRTEINKQLEVYSNKDKLLSMLLDLFPQLKGIFHHGYSIETFQDWYRDKRICSPQYFERYFSYVVQEGDISDVYFKDLLSGLELGEIEKVVTRFEKELTNINPDTFIFKIKQYVAEFPREEALVLALVLARFGDYYSKVRHMMFFSGKGEVAYMIRELLEKTTKEERGEICVLLLRQAQPFEFAVEIQSRFRAQPRYPDESSFLCDNDIKRIVQTLADRFSKESEGANIFKLLPDHSLWAIFLMYLESGKGEEAKKIFLRTLGESNENALRIIKIFTPSLTSSTRSTPGPYKANFTKESYDEIKKFIDPVLLYEKTLEVYGKKMYVPVTDLRHDELTDENLIGIFQKTHEET